MQDFHPKIIYIEESVRDLPVTARVVAKFPDLPIVFVKDRSEIKKPQEHTHAKKQLFIAEFKGKALKTCQGMGNYVCCQYHTIALVTDCHLECTYCILQDYLKNNPVITIYANIETIFAEISQKLALNRDRVLRIGTGELSDSLALDSITEFSRDLYNFVCSEPNVVMELKTKTSQIAILKDLPAHPRLIVSWSINPQKYVEREELKCDDLDSRLNAGYELTQRGYSIGLHLDPLLYFQDWEKQYTDLVLKLAQKFKPEQIAWISLGSLRFTPDLKKISQARFVNSPIMAGELFPSSDGKTRYFRPLREQMYKKISDLLSTHLKKVPHYLCMETKPVWRNVFGDVPEHNGVVEKHLLKNLQVEPQLIEQNLTSFVNEDYWV